MGSRLRLSTAALAAAVDQAEQREATIVAAVGSTAARLDSSLVSAAYQAGVLVQLHVCWWRGFKVLKPEDLGMHPAKAVKAFLDEAIHLGGKRLLPKEILSRLKSLEVMGRATLAELSFETLFGRFVPCTAYGEWKRRYAEYQEQFYTVRDRILTDHDAIVDEIRRAWLDNAPRLYRMANARSAPAGWADEVANRIAGQVRSRDEIEETFRYEQELRIVPIPSEAEVDALRAEQVNRARRLGADRAALVDEFDRDLQTELGKRKDHVLGFVEGIQQQVFDAIGKLAAETHATLSGSKGVPTRTVDRLRRLTGQLRSMNFMQDPKVTDWLDQIDTDATAPELSSERLLTTLRVITDQAGAELEQARKVNVSYRMVARLQDKP